MNDRDFITRAAIDRRTLLKGAAALGLAAGAGQRFAGLGAAATNLQFWDMVWGPPEYIDTGKKLVDQFNKA
ncbi:MAG TPA: hypothetical protein VFX03_01970, partial [Thermomicrobiales bacterium]|nr:hypothetical protein [Thermomicrobiales bacterium]